MGKHVDLTGQTFGRLTCIRCVGTRNQHRIWLCECSCGNQTEVTTGNLRSSHTQSCGCLQKEKTSEAKIVHGLFFDEHGKRTKLYKVWSTMKERCFNSHSRAFADYGGRGITVCDEWKDYEPFHRWAMNNGYRVGLTIERENVNGNYEPGNCKWVTRKEQATNKTNTVFINYKGQKRKLIEWSKILGIDSEILRNRLRRGWTIERAFTQPLRGEKCERN